MTHRLLVGPDLLLFGDVGDAWGDGSGFSARDVIEALAIHGDGDLTVRINSGGGFVKDGVSIYNSLRNHAGKVTTVNEGIAASAASVIFMAGEERIANAGSLLMIHDPSSITWGNAKDHADTAAVLNKIGEQMARLYAERTGETPEAMRAAMLSETWMDEVEAEGFNFATKTANVQATAAVPFDFALYQRAPETLRGAQRALPEARAAASTAAPPAAPAAPSAAVAAVPAPQPEPSMSEKTQTPPAAPAAPAPVVAVVDVSAQLLTRCNSAGLSGQKAAEIIAAAGGCFDKGRDLIIDAVAARDPEAHRSAPGISPAVVTADVRDRFKQGVTLALLAKAGMGGERNEYTGMTLRELARESITMAGGRANFSDPMTMAAVALGVSRDVTMAAGQQSTSDFANLLANVANKSMMKGYDEAQESFDQWTAKGSLVDFKPAKRVDLNLFPALAQVDEGGEYTLGTMGDRGETIQLATYGKMFAITRQAIINDDLNSFTRVPMRMGRAAKRTIGNLVYAVLTTNGAMSDGVALFHATHKNLAGTPAAITVASLDAARAAMAVQQDPDANAVALNIRPAWFLVPVGLEGVARVLMDSEKDPNASVNSNKPNQVRGLAKVVSDARLDTNSATSWYLTADANQHDTIEVAYLNGVETPVMEQREGWNVDGVEFKVRIDAGVKALDFRGMFKNAGA